MTVAVIGGGPAGLMAAETLASAGRAVTVFDHMPSVGRKLLMAGRGGLNLTHSEPLGRLLDRYGPAECVREAVRAFPPEALVAWCEGLGQAVFTGSSGRIFPRAMKASPLLRAWLGRLRDLGVRIVAGRRWVGLDAGGVRFADGSREAAEAVVLACGGASWPRLGSDGDWIAALPDCHVTPLRPANMGFSVAWSESFARRFAGAPLKRIALSFGAERVLGEALVTARGLEGSGVYALSAPLREALARGPVVLLIDVRPDLETAELARRLATPRRGQSLANFLRKTLGLPPVAIGLVQEALHTGSDPRDLAGLIRALPVRLLAPHPLARAISTCGGLVLDELDGFMLRRHPGVFAAGEMLDWEAPTGGYLLQGCLSTGRVAGLAAASWRGSLGA